MQVVNWGRIVTLHAFCGCIAKFCEARHIPDCADDIANVLAEFVVHRLGLWIVTQGGWVSDFFIVFFFIGGGEVLKKLNSNPSERHILDCADDIANVLAEFGPEVPQEDYGRERSF